MKNKVSSTQGNTLPPHIMFSCVCNLWPAGGAVITMFSALQVVIETTETTARNMIGCYGSLRPTF